MHFSQITGSSTDDSRDLQEMDFFVVEQEKVPVDLTVK